MSQDRRYARGAEDMQEFIARVLEAQVRLYPEHAAMIQGFANVARSLAALGVRGAMEADDGWMRKVAERELERQRAGWRDRTAAYQDRQRRRVAGEDVPALKRGRKKGVR